MQFHRFVWFPVLMATALAATPGAAESLHQAKSPRSLTWGDRAIAAKAIAPAAGPATKQTQATTATIIDTAGTLEPGDSVLSSDQTLYDEYTFTGRAGQQLTITLTSSDFDTYLFLVGPEGETVAENDDDAAVGGTNSRIQTTLPSNGVYSLVVNSYSVGEQGAYQVTATTILGTGDIQATLSWNSTDDLDLIVMEPSEEIVSFDNTPIASGGQLDVDANALCQNVTQTPVENIFWPTGRAPQGEYRILVNLYDRCASTQGPIPFTLTLTVQGTTEVFEGTVDEENDSVVFSTAVY